MDILVSGAHHLEQATTLYSCHGVFTDRSIFSLNLPRNLKLGDQSQAHTKFLTDVITGREKPKMAERGEESSDGFSSSSVDSCEDFGSPSPSSSSGESANEVEPDTSSISRPSSSKRKKNDSPPRSTGKATEKQQQKKNKKGKLSLTNDEIEELSSWIFSTQEDAQVEVEIRPRVHA